MDMEKLAQSLRFVELINKFNEEEIKGLSLKEIGWETLSEDHKNMYRRQAQQITHFLDTQNNVYWF